MESDRWRRVQELFEAAADLPADEQEACLDAACGDDPELRREVETLLRSDASAGGFIESAIRRGSDLLLAGDPDPLAAQAALGRIGKYEILGRIGEGGFGVVYRGRDPVLQRYVAVKTCSSRNQKLRRRFLREGQIAAALQHPNITTVHDLEEEGGVPYLVQEFLEGEDLNHKIARQEPLTALARLDILVQVARGLEYAHLQGVLHRDVKPANIRILPSGAVKIMDFGIAKLLHEASDVTTQGVTLGTVGYLAPEQLRGEEVDRRTDVFSFGVLLYELLAYERPFKGSTFSEVSYRLLNEEPRALRELAPSYGPAIAALCGRCLAKDPRQRCASFGEVIAVLEPEIDALRSGAFPQLLPAAPPALRTSPTPPTPVVGEAAAGPAGPGSDAAAPATAALTPAAAGSGGGPERRRSTAPAGDASRPAGGAPIESRGEAGVAAGKRDEPGLPVRLGDEAGALAGPGGEADAAADRSGEAETAGGKAARRADGRPGGAGPGADGDATDPQSRAGSRPPRRRISLRAAAALVLLGLAIGFGVRGVLRNRQGGLPGAEALGHAAAAKPPAAPDRRASPEPYRSAATSAPRMQVGLDRVAPGISARLPGDPGRPGIAAAGGAPRPTGPTIGQAARAAGAASGPARRTDSENGLAAAGAATAGGPARRAERGGGLACPGAGPGTRGSAGGPAAAAALAPGAPRQPPAGDQAAAVPGAAAHAVEVDDPSGGRMPGTAPSSGPKGGGGSAANGGGAGDGGRGAVAASAEGRPGEVEAAEKATSPPAAPGATAASAGGGGDSGAGEPAAGGAAVPADDAASGDRPMATGDLIAPGAPGAVPPRLINRPAPKYPDRARRRQVEADVLMLVLVDESGQVVQAIVKRTDDHGLGFNEAARRAALAATFEPARRNGLPGKMWTELPFSFRLHEEAPAAAAAHPGGRDDR